MFDLESRRTQRRIAFTLGLIVLFFVSMSQSCSELKHRQWAVEATAEIATAEPSIHKKNALCISFFVNDENGQRTRIKRTVPASLGPFAPKQEVVVEYLTGHVDDARLLAERSVFWPMVFLVMLGAVVVWILIVVWQQMRS